MSRSNRLCVVAVRGWLIAVLVLLPCPSTAQQETEELPAALEQSQGTAVEAPAPQSETPKPPAQQEPPAAQLPPAAPVQSERPAPPSCDKRCQEAEQREKDDLEAQQSMAEFAFDLVVISRWQFVAGTIGIILLLLTLWYTRKSTRAATAAAKAAEDVVEVTSETAQRQLRAYVTTQESVWTNTGDTWCFSHHWKNTGPTPAMRTLTHVNWEAFDGEIPDGFDYPDAGRDRGNDPTVVGPEQTLLSWPIFIPHAVMDDPSRNVYIWGWADYDDVFTNTARHRTEFCYEVTLDRGAAGVGKVGIGLRIYGPFNGADDDAHHKPKI